MKKLIATLSLLSTIAFSTQISAENQSVALTTSQDLIFSLNPNGALEGTPQWSAVGPGVLQVFPTPTVAKLITAGAGTNVVTVSWGNLSVVVTVTITAPPATALGLTTTITPK